MTDVELDYHLHGQPGVLRRRPPQGYKIALAPIRAVTDDRGDQWATTIHDGAIHTLNPSWRR